MATGLVSIFAAFFVVVMLVIFFGAIVSMRRGLDWGFARNAPSVLTALGILSAFGGIVTGLLSFDVSAVQDTASTLLLGLKSALLTCSMGVSLAIVFRGLAASGVLGSMGSDRGDDKSVGVSDLYQVMVEQRDGTRDLLDIAKEQRQVMSGVEFAIAGNDEASLVTQMKRQRIDTQVYQQDCREAFRQQQQSIALLQRELRSQLGDFSKQVSSAATEQVINALQEVVIDFNLSMTEQFGENFKCFNHAVVQLVEWQDSYKQQLEEMRSQYALGVNAVTKAELSLASITDHARKIPEVMKHLKQVMEVNQHQIGELGRHLDAFSDVRERAVEAVPALRAQVDETVHGLQLASKSLIEGVSVSSEQVQQAFQQGACVLVDGSQQVNDMLVASSATLCDQNERMRNTLVNLVGEFNGSLGSLPADLLEGSRKITEELRSSGKSLLQESEASRQAFDLGLHDMREQLTAALMDMSNQQTAEAQRIFAGLHREIDNVLGQTGDAVSKQVNMIDETLAQEIATTLTEMGGALTSITGQFTEDYKELVGAMKNVVKAA